MKAAFACWDNRIAPVFDTAREIRVVEVEAKRIVRESQEMLPDASPAQKVLRLAELNIGTLTCGAISRAMHALVTAYGIQVVPFVVGDLQEVIRAWLTGSLERDVFAMPGCCALRRRRRMRGLNEDECEMYRQGCSGKGAGQGRRGQGKGRMGGPRSAGAVGMCICPQCGHSEPHERGVPCTQKQCPKCGAALARQ
jgi:predicted Fe-Mo cluster-binding NifX family protein